MKILIVDDEDDLIRILKDIFDRLGEHFLYASSGEEAFKLLNRFPVGLVISDMRMPNGNGMELLLKTKASFPEIEFYFHTASDVTPEEDDFIRGVIKKPNGFPEMMKLIKNYLKKDP